MSKTNGHSGIRLAPISAVRSPTLCSIAGAERLTRKVLTTAQRPEEGVLEATRLGAGGCRPAFLRHRCVRATARRWPQCRSSSGVRTHRAIATEGFRDVLDIATESRYDQYDLTIEKPKPLVPRALRFTDAGARRHFTARLRLAPTRMRFTQRVTALKDNGIDAVAICFMHSYVNADHEERTAAILKKAMPGLRITLPRKCAPRIREYERTLDGGSPTPMCSR